MSEYNILMEVEYYHYRCLKCNCMIKSKMMLNFCQLCGIKYDISADVMRNDIESLKECIVEIQKRILMLESRVYLDNSH